MKFEITSFKNNPGVARRILSKALTAVENATTDSSSINEEAFKSKKETIKIGITGAPGAGKSSLINLLIESLVKDGLSIGILAIDPSSPFTGGALLGDRTRMHSSELYSSLYIRSSSTRGHLGGISPKTPEMLSVINAFDFDIIIVETVGVGQAELDIMKCVDLTAVVLSPNMGDSLQALKAGLIEIADIFILNKADIPSVSELERDLLFSLSLGPHDKKRPNIYKTSCLNPIGIDELKLALFSEHNNIKSSGELAKRKLRSLDFQLELNLRENLNSMFNKNQELNNNKKMLLEKIYKHQISPREAAQQIFSKIEGK